MLLQTALERQSVAIFLMTANLIENPLLCARANNPVQRSRGTVLFGSLVYSEIAERGREESNRAGGIKSKLRRVIKEGTDMDRGRGITDWTEIKRQKRYEGGRKKGER